MRQQEEREGFRLSLEICNILALWSLVNGRNCVLFYFVVLVIRPILSFRTLFRIVLLIELCTCTQKSVKRHA